MNEKINQLIEGLKKASTIHDAARLTKLLLRECGFFDAYSIGLEIARLQITTDPNEGRVTR